MTLSLKQRFSTFALCSTLVSTAAVPAWAMYPPPPPKPESAAAREVEALNSAAVEKFQAKEYDDAARLFEEAYNINPEPNYLFNIGRVFEEKGDLSQAVQYYERFMNEPGVELQAREIALERVRVLKEIIRENEAEEDAAAAAKAAEDAAAQGPAEEEPVDEDPKPLPPMRIAGIALIAVGGVVLAAGGGFAGAAVARSNELDSLNTMEPRDDAITRGKRNALIADSMFIAGGVLAITGVVLTVVSFTKKGNGSKRASVTPAITPRGGGLTAKVRF